MSERRQTCCTPAGSTATASCNTRTCSYPAGTFPSRNSESTTTPCSAQYVVSGWYALNF